MDLASPQAFGARLRAARRSQDLTMDQLSAKAGIAGHNALMRMERAQNEPGLFRAARAAAALGVSLDALLAPAECEACDDRPPPGFICPDCRKRGATR